MSLLIKGMDMLNHAVRNGTDDTMYRSCVLVHPNGTAELVVDLEFADQFNFDHNLKRFPLTEIPTPHGRLIDADALLSRLNGIKYAANVEDWISRKPIFADGLEEEIISAPTIIEAEE